MLHIPITIRRLFTQVCSVPAIVAAPIKLCLKLYIALIRWYPSLLLPEQLARKQIILSPTVGMRSMDPSTSFGRRLLASAVLSTITRDHVKMPSSSTSTILFALFYVFLITNLEHSSKSSLRAKLITSGFPVVNKVFARLMDAPFFEGVLSVVRSFMPML